MTEYDYALEKIDEMINIKMPEWRVRFAIREAGSAVSCVSDDTNHQHSRMEECSIALCNAIYKTFIYELEREHIRQGILMEIVGQIRKVQESGDAIQAKAQLIENMLGKCKISKEESDDYEYYDIGYAICGSIGNLLANVRKLRFFIFEQIIPNAPIKYLACIMKDRTNTFFQHFKNESSPLIKIMIDSIDKQLYDAETSLDSYVAIITLVDEFQYVYADSSVNFLLQKIIDCKGDMPMLRNFAKHCKHELFLAATKTKYLSENK